MWTDLTVGCRCRPVKRCPDFILDYKHRRVPRTAVYRLSSRTRSRPATDGGPTAEARHHLGGQHLSKAGVKDGVDGEVNGRVGDDQDVADAAVVELEAATEACRVVQDIPEDLVQERRSLTDTEDDDDDDEDQCHVVVLRLTHALYTNTAPAECLLSSRSQVSMSKTFMGGAGSREFESEAPATEEMLHRVVYAAENSSLFTARCTIVQGAV